MHSTSRRRFPSSSSGGGGGADKMPCNHPHATKMILAVGFVLVLYIIWVVTSLNAKLHAAAQEQEERLSNLQKKLQSAQEQRRNKLQKQKQQKEEDQEREKEHHHHHQTHLDYNDNSIHHNNNQQQQKEVVAHHNQDQHQQQQQQQQQQHQDDDESDFSSSSFSFGTGYAVSDHDNQVHAHPGGTEQEANHDRIKLEEHNRPFYESGEFWRLKWRIATFDQSLEEKKEKFPKELLQTQEHHHHRHPHDDDSSMRKTGLELLDTAIAYCRNDFELWNFACLIDSYQKQLHPPHSHHHDEEDNEECNRVYGSELVNRFRKHKHEMCLPITQFSQSSHSHSSSLTCYQDRIQREHTIDTSICGGKNVAVNFDKIQDGDFPWLQFETGALQLRQCSIDSRQKQTNWNFMHCLKDWMDLGLQVSSSSNNKKLACSPRKTRNIRGNENDKRRNKHNKNLKKKRKNFFVTRSGDYSPFALAHDWINTVILFAVANISRHQVNLYIMERMTIGFFSPMWTLAFSPSRPVEWFPDLRRKYQGRGPVCFYGDDDNFSNQNENQEEQNQDEEGEQHEETKHHHQQHQRHQDDQEEEEEESWFNIPARLSPLYNTDDCRSSALVRFTSDLLVSRLGAGFVQSPRNCFVIVLIVRRNYQTGHPIERRIPNWRELLKGLRDHLPPLLSVAQNNNNNNQKKSSASTTSRVVVHAIDYADFDFDEQINITRSADLLIGMHGAGLIQSMFLPHRWGGLFEFFCPDRPPSNNRYEKLSKRLGIQYSSFNIDDSENIVPVSLAVEKIQELAKRIQRMKQKTRRH